MEDRIEAAREVMRQVGGRGDWESAFDPDLPPELAALTQDIVDAYRRGDLEWLLEHTDPDVEIVQVPEIPDARTYSGHDGMVEALLDWPRQWEDFRITPERIFAPDPENLIVKAVHGGRGRDRVRVPRARRADRPLGHVPDGRRGATPRCPEPR